jgi:LysM repeat protein/FtsZ-binding cell division protein ZapB
MSFLGQWILALPAAAALALAAGCSPDTGGPTDDEKESHYALGKSRVNALNYPGAIEEFEASLEANPHSAPAHYQLAMLFENQLPDPAAAIYHYQQYLKYDPKADNADLITQHIANCKQQLASDVLQLPSTPAAQQQLEKLTEENKRLRDQLTQWQNYCTALQGVIKTNTLTIQALQAQLAQQVQQAQQAQATATTPEDPAGPAPFSPTAAATNTAVQTTATGLSRNASPRHISPSSHSARRTHTITSGETLASIARKEGVPLSALETANPGVNPRKLRAGQVLILPAP